MLPQKPPLRRALASVGLGRLAYLLWHAPRGWLVRSRREGGPFQQWIDRRGRRQMEAAAWRLPALTAPAADAPEVCFLTGKRFWYQTAFCGWSLAHAAGAPLRVVLHDDGTFDRGLAEEARRVFPGCTIVDAAEAGQRLDTALPERKFPALRSQRRSYIHLRKLTDFHAGRAGWRLVIDSDMLFFRRPDAVLAWLAAPQRPLHMVDVFTSYGYAEAALEALVAPARLPRNINVGACGLQSDALDWARIEAWCAHLLAQHGTSYYLEQALVALILAGRETTALPAADYRVLPDEAECRAPTAVLHHYVAGAKRGYFRHAWRHVSGGARSR